ncbi:hypothetical protein GCM10010358_29660 [Streptomyces minutiscleroticus]|uniref:Uncharacterized protein n=1 Tax=Streptomyces minutiscleroticus TaxID=68238 RepID=A0A918NJS6_9ACTN|nr:hypothetical protein [Streptomyces minutiscleroticus]GGX73223.1 hypothetical protein GCM10010358_29660 [Streptomyces minutiscleroticus]
MRPSPLIGAALLTAGGHRARPIACCAGVAVLSVFATTRLGRGEANTDEVGTLTGRTPERTATP